MPPARCARPSPGPEGPGTRHGGSEHSCWHRNQGLCFFLTIPRFYLLEIPAPVSLLWDGTMLRRELVGMGVV